MTVWAAPGQTDFSMEVFLEDATTGLADTGLLWNSAGATGSYSREGTYTRTAITMATQTVGGAHSDGGFVEIDATNMKGVYRFDPPDAAFATGAEWVTIYLEFDGTKEYAQTIPIGFPPAFIEAAALDADTDDYDAVMELSSMDRAASAHGGATDTVTVSFFKNDDIVANGSITSPQIHIVEVGDGTVIANWASLSSGDGALITGTDTYRYEITGANLIADGDAYLCRARATIDGSTRSGHVPRALGRDTSS